MSFSNKKINLNQVDPSFSEKSSLTGYSSNLVDINQYLFAPYVDYVNSKYDIYVGPFNGIRAVTVGAGGGGGGSGHDSFVYYNSNTGGFMNKYGGTGGGGGCGQINHGVINDLYSTYGVYTFNVIVGTGGSGGAGGIHTSGLAIFDGNNGGNGGNSYIHIQASNNNDYYPVLSLGGGGGGGGGGVSGDIIDYTGQMGMGGFAGISYGWVNNSLYYGNKATNGGENLRVTLGRNTINPYGVLGGSPGFLNGWCNTRLSSDITPNDFGKGGTGGYKKNHNDFNSQLTSTGIALTDNGTAGITGNGGFVRVYFINLNNSIDVLNGNFSLITPSPSPSSFTILTAITNWDISGSGFYGCSGGTVFSPVGDNMTINRPFINYLALEFANNTISISQTLTLPIGNYNLSFYTWPKPNGYVSTQSLNVLINNINIFNKTYTPNSGVTLETVSFTVSSQSTELKFSSTNTSPTVTSSICIAGISVYVPSEAVNYNLISDGSLNSWTNMGITTNSTIGKPGPSIQATTSYSYGYINVATIHPGFTTFLDSTITFDIYATSGNLVNLYFACNSYGQGDMFRLESRSAPNNITGLAKTTSWSVWAAPTFGPNSVPHSIWYRFVITINSAGYATYSVTFLDAYPSGPVSAGYTIDYTFTYQISDLGTYIGVHADGLGGGYVDNIYIDNATSTMTPLPVAPTSNTFTISNQSGNLSFKNGTYIMSSSSRYDDFQPFNAFDNNKESMWHSQGTGRTAGYPISTTPVIGAYTRDGYDTNGNFQGGNANAIWKTTISGTDYPGEWLQIQLPYSFILTSHTYVHREGYLWTKRGPKLFYVAGSNNGSTWFMLHQQDYTGVGDPAYGVEGAPITYRVSNNSTYYSYYRIIFNKIYGNIESIGNVVNLSKWKLSGTRKDISLEKDLVYHYRFNSGDISGNMLANYAKGIPVYDATVVGATIDTTTTKFGGGSLSLDGINQYISLPAFTSDYNGLSFSVWIKTTSTGWARIFDFGNGAGVDNILMSPKNGITVYNGGTVGDQPLGFNQESGSWVHIAWTLEYTNSVNKTGTSKIYVNGSTNDTYTRKNFKFYPNPYPRSLNYLGKSNWTGDPFFAGNMDEFRTYKRILNSTEISNLYTKNSLT